MIRKTCNNRLEKQWRSDRAKCEGRTELKKKTQKRQTTSKHANIPTKQTNKQTSKQPTKQPNEQTHKQTTTTKHSKNKQQQTMNKKAKETTYKRK